MSRIATIYALKKIEVIRSSYSCSCIYCLFHNFKMNAGRSKIIRDRKAFWHCSKYRVSHSRVGDETKRVVERCREGIQRGGGYE
jgi:hypothetical protein